MKEFTVRAIRPGRHLVYSKFIASEHSSSFFSDPQPAARQAWLSKLRENIPTTRAWIVSDQDSSFGFFHLTALGDTSVLATLGCVAPPTGLQSRAVVMCIACAWAAFAQLDAETLVASTRRDNRSIIAILHWLGFDLATTLSAPQAGFVQADRLSPWISWQLLRRRFPPRERNTTVARFIESLRFEDAYYNE